MNFKIIKQKLLYYLIRTLIFPISFLSFKKIHRLGNFLGYFAYFFLKEYRKKALSNLALAKSLNLSNKEIKKIALKSFQNFSITMLEYPKLFLKKDFTDIISCQNPKKAQTIYNQKRGIIFFCAHQSNWEVLFLDGTKKMQGIAIAKPIKNKELYNWIIKIREKFNGKIIDSKNAIKHSIKSLKNGVFLGIISDQSQPNSNYSYDFFQRRAKFSSSAALLSYRTNSPIIIATTKRLFGKYVITYSDPIYPNLQNSKDKEVKRLMDLSLSILEDKIKKRPHEWLWQHNLYKQQTPEYIYKKFRHDSLCIVLPKEKDMFLYVIDHLATLKELYKEDFIFILCPCIYKKYPIIDCEKIIYYNDYEETLIEDYKFKLIYNFTPFTRIKKHFLSLSAFSVFTIEDLQKEAYKNFSNKNELSLSQIFKAAILRKRYVDF